MEDRRLGRDGEADRAAGFVEPVAVQGTGGRVVGWVAIAAVLLVVAVLKPWGGGAPAPTRATVGAGQGDSIRPSGSVVPPGPSPTLPSDIDVDVTRACLDPGSWRVASVEAYEGQTIRVWRALDPAVAAGPDDPAIPFVLVVSEGVSELGWCAPAAGPDRPAGETIVAAWSVRGDVSHALRLVPTHRTPRASSFGALYGPRSVAAAHPTAPLDRWPAGRYVFRLRLADGRERWFGVDVESRPAVRPPRPAPSPTAGAGRPGRDQAGSPAPVP